MEAGCFFATSFTTEKQGVTGAWGGYYEKSCKVRRKLTGQCGPV